MPPPYTALVFGGTGATGSALVKELAQRPDTWGAVIVPVRGEATPADLAGAGPPVRCVPKTDFTDLAASLSTIPPVDAAFICLGTTRARAGSAAAFVAADLDAPASAARFSAARGARHLALVSAAGAARGGAWAPHARLLHGQLYRATKGAAEEAVLAAGAPSTSIFRPGLLERGPAFSSGRWLERAAAAVLPGLPVADLARAMAVDAAAVLGEAGGRAAAVRERVWSDAEIRRLAAGSG